MSSGQNPPDCPKGWSDEFVAGFGTLTAPTASCSACSCSSVMGVTCTLATSSIYSGTTCSSLTSLGTYTPQTMNCATDWPANAVGVRPNGGTSASGVGSCTPSGGQPTITPAQLELQARVCKAKTSGGCENGKVCVPKAEGSSGGVCIYSSGNATCPEGPYSNATVVSDIADDRNCSACTCTLAQSPTCTAKTMLYSDTNCMTLKATLTHATSSCTNVGTGTKSVMHTATMNGGACTPKGGTPTGSAQKSKPRTICCK
jgi:hypothetical protein